MSTAPSESSPPVTTTIAIRIHTHGGTDGTAALM